MELQEIKEFLAQHKDREDVRAFLMELRAPSLDDVKRFVEQNEEGQKWLQAEKDRAVTKGIETWKNNNLDKLVQDKLNELNPPETEAEKRLRKLEQELEKERKERVRESLRNKAYKQATEKGLPVELLDFLVAETEESTMENLSTLEKVWQDAQKKIVESQFKSNGRTPQNTSGSTQYAGPNPWKKESFNLTQQAKLLKENPELAKQLQSQVK